MSEISVIVVEPNGASHEIEVLEDLSVRELIDELAAALELPRTYADGSEATYRLYSKNLAQDVETSGTLRSGGVTEGDVIRVAPIPLAGGWSPLASADVVAAVSAALTGGAVTYGLTVLKEWLGGKASRTIRLRSGDREVEL
ncbi:MAG: hypothetical protein GY701_19595, partial [Sulfitobacter sp.]|nr:hypothetical protein [Sulfitobacter sp.]